MLEGHTQSVHCLICSRPARRGATLCAQCKAALRRSRHTPGVASEFLPQHPVVRTDTRRSVERSSASARAPRRAPRPTAAPALGGWGTYATIIAFGLAVCLTGYLAIGDEERALYLGDSRGIPAAPVKAPGDVNAMARAPLPSLAVDSEPTANAADDEHTVTLESPAPASQAVADKRTVRASRGANAAFPAMGVPNASVEPTPPLVALAQVAAASAVSEPAVPDRWQQLASTLSRCERENVIAGLVCKERARLQYCEGEWGAAPQCPAAVASLNTR